MLKTNVDQRAARLDPSHGVLAPRQATAHESGVRSRTARDPSLAVKLARCVASRSDAAIGPVLHRTSVERDRSLSEVDGGGARRGQATRPGSSAVAPARLAARRAGSSARAIAHEAAVPLILRLLDPVPPATEVIDERIDVRAQFAFLRLFRRGGTDAARAIGLFRQIKAGEIGGIFGDDLGIAARIAARQGTVRWELVPQGSDIVTTADEAGRPVLVFRQSAGSAPRLDTAILSVADYTPAGGVTTAEPIEESTWSPVAGQVTTLDHYVFEIKAWIPFAQVPDPEEGIQDLAFRLRHLGDEVSDYHSQYHGDGHKNYSGSARVIHRVEFDWDGVAIRDFKVPKMQHYGTTHREFSALVKPIGGLGSVRLVKGVEARTVDHAVSESFKPAVNPREVKIGMASPNPLTIFPSPDVDADYTLFISRDLGEDTITVRWSTDHMPNHGFRIEKNGTDVKEKVTNKLPTTVSVADIAVRLTNKTNGGSDTVTTVPGSAVPGSA